MLYLLISRVKILRLFAFIKFLDQYEGFRWMTTAPDKHKRKFAKKMNITDINKDELSMAKRPTGYNQIYNKSPFIPNVLNLGITYIICCVA